MNPSRISPAGSVLALVVAGLALVTAACTQDPAQAKQRYLERARGHFARAEYSETILELKNALQIDPKFPPAVHLMGRAYAVKSWHVDAARELSRAAELEPENLDVRRDLGRALLVLEAWDDVLRTADLVAARAPDDAFAGYLRVAALNARGQREEAAKAIAKALRSGPALPELHTVHGDILAGLGRPVEAEQAYRAALRGNQSDVAALVGLGNVLRRQRRPEEARQLFEQAKAAQPTSATARLALSAILADGGKVDDALKELEALPRRSWTPRVAAVAGELYVRTGKHREAVAQLRPMAQALPDFLPAHYWLGHALLRLGQHDEAMAEFRGITQRAPDNAQARYSLALALLQTGQPREAMAELSRLATALQKLPDYHLQVGRTQLLLGAPDAAIKSARVALGLAPEEPRAWSLIGSAHLSRGDLRQAHEAYAKALEVDPAFTGGRLALGHVYGLEQKLDSALEQYEAALKQNPHFQPAVAAKVATLVRQNRLDDAIAFARTVQTSEPRNTSILETLGRLYVLKRDLRAAEDAFTRALQIEDRFAPARLGLARVALARQKPADAAPLLQRVVKDQPDNVVAALMLADLHARQGRHDQATPVLEAAGRANREVPALMLPLAKLYIQVGRYDAAIERLAPLIKENRGFVQARMLTGLARLRKLDLAGAAAEFEAVNRVNPRIADNHYQLGRVLLAQGDVEGARREHRLAAELAPKSTQFKLELSRLTDQASDPALATARIQELVAAVARDPGNASLRDALAQTYLSSGRDAEAEAEYKRILDAAPAFISANRGMALLRFRQKRPEEALGHLQAVLRIDPADIPANLAFADHHESRGQTERAIAHLEAIHRANPALSTIALRLARLYGRVGRVPDGIARTKEVLAREPRSALAHLTIGGLHLERGDAGAAVDALNTATRLDPELALAHFTLGNAYEQKGDIAGAVAAYRRTMALNPKNAEPYNNIAWIYATQGKNLDEALALAQKAHELAPTHAGILDTLGFVHYRRGEYQKAEPILKKATEIAANDATSFHHLGLTYHKLGRRDDAAFALRRALQVHGTGPRAAEIRGLLDELRK